MSITKLGKPKNGYITSSHSKNFPESKTNLWQSQKTKGKEQLPKLSAAELQQAQDAATTSLEVYKENPYGLMFPDNMPQQDYLAFGQKIGIAMRMVAWKIGDYVNFGMKTYGYKSYTEISAATGLDETYLRTCSSVASRIPIELRHVAPMDKWRLMLGSQKEKETLSHLAERLGRKTYTQLREMKKRQQQSDQEITATELYSDMDNLIEKMSQFDANERGAAFLAMDEQSKDENDKHISIFHRLKKMTDMLEEAMREAVKSGQ